MPGIVWTEAERPAGLGTAVMKHQERVDHLEMESAIHRAGAWCGRHALITSLGLAVIAAAGCYDWMIRDLGSGCGVSPRFPQFGSSFDYTRAYLVLVGGATAVTSVCATLTRSLAVLLRASFMTAVLTAGGITIAMFMFLSGRGCFT